MNEFNLSGKLVLVTGGGSGLGLSMACTFIRYGAKVIISGRRENVLREAVEKLGPQASFITADLSELANIPALVNRIEQEYGPLDVLVNNAGIHLKKDALDVSDAEFENVVRTNQSAVFALSREVARKMIPRKKGSIVMVSSMASRYGIPKVIAYTAAKSAIEGMTRALAVEWSPAGVRINCIAPGFIETEMSAKALNNDPERKNKVLGRTPMQKLGKPEDVGLAAVFLASDAAGFITGASLAVDGGNSIGF
ncbi:SDR family NAD(P)-dependent oxidoreductase [Chitinophaga sp. GCM10012297]|uniref:Glucose 1-dehydrogenase n=1 Tax=Chitinophaga chungangae TaxID=2821488 RepID=A0ABS3YF01_9BACT|nr:glucose 1-dehydrogenase [Chitinophaga chungangae]MBO9152873.1 glucose 1-dehydrogenase [Chitinophaga chungangae]